MSKLKVVLAVVGVAAAGYGHSRSLTGARAEAERKGYVKGYKEALPVGACYGARSVANNLGIPVNFECKVIPDELLPERPKEEGSEE